VAAQVVEQYAQPAVMTDRVAELARSVTASATNDHDRIEALEDWMGDNTTYSIEAPLAPRGVDVVDDFLFVSQEGWCEQIASSLVVMARAVGVPARLATGFAPGDWDGVGGRFVVRELDAHAWAEVWFPDTGWVSFDPTADVPLSGTDEAAAGADAQDWREVAGAVLLVIGVIALAAGPVLRLVRRYSGRARGRRAHRRVVRERWDAAAEARLEQLGVAAGRPRGPGETVTAYAVAVAGLVGDERVRRVGVLVDRARYGPDRSAGDGSELPDRPEHADAAGRTDGSDRDFVDEVLSSH
jgi:Transglutaminase-like superfamily